MLLMSYTNISPSFILILSSIQEKQKKYFLIHSNIDVDAINFEFWIHKKNNFNILKRNIFPSNKNFHLLNIKILLLWKKSFGNLYDNHSNFGFIYHLIYFLTKVFFMLFSTMA